MRESSGATAQERTTPWLWRTTWARLAEFPALTAVGLLGMGLGAFCLLLAVVLGVEIPPEGNLVDTATFNGSVGFFILTMVMLATEVRWTPKGRRWWSTLLVVFAVYSFGIETIQALRGLDPRFSRVAGPTDQLLGGVFFLVALGILMCFVPLALKYFRQPVSPLTAAVRYAAAASFVAFGVGIVMSVATLGRHVPEAGNLLVLHAAGFHGLQAIPLVALVLGWAGTPGPLALRRVHVAGTAWLAACLAVGWQSGSGRAVTTLSPALALAALALLAFALVVLFAVRELVRSNAALTNRT